MFRDYCVILTTKELKEYLPIINQYDVRYIVSVHDKSDVWALSFRTSVFKKSRIDKELSKLNTKNDGKEKEEGK